MILGVCWEIKTIFCVFWSTTTEEINFLGDRKSDFEGKKKKNWKLCKKEKDNQIRN